MATSFFYIHVMATSFFCIYIYIFIYIYIYKLTERSVVLLNAIFFIHICQRTICATYSGNKQSLYILDTIAYSRFLSALTLLFVKYALPFHAMPCSFREPAVVNESWRKLLVKLAKVEQRLTEDFFLQKTTTLSTRGGKGWHDATVSVAFRFLFFVLKRANIRIMFLCSSSTPGPQRCPGITNRRAWLPDRQASWWRL